jgi:hypothetical protein
MAQLPSVFKADKDSKMGFAPIPAGWYIAEITKSEYKQTAAKTGHYLTCQFKIIAPEEYKGKMVFNLLNLDNPNQTAVEIANKEMDVMCNACEVDEIEDSTELHGIPMGIRVAVDPGDANWPPKNVIKDYKVESETEIGGDSPFDEE